jgi:cysteine desulfurase
MDRKVYMDYGATTPLDPEVLKVMKGLQRHFGNPSSLHSYGMEAKSLLEEARAKVAGFLGAESNEVIFTSGATESDNLAIIGYAMANKDKGNHIITSGIEHPAVLESCRFLEKHGFSITYVPVCTEGIIDPGDVAKAITPKTMLISIAHANHEIGTIQPIEEIGRIAKENDIAFHTRAAESCSEIPVSAKHSDMLSIAGHKVYGPRGMGALYVRKGTRLRPLMVGGSQEMGLRSGTENVPGAVGMAKALEIVKETRDKESKHLAKLRDTLIKNVLEIGDSWLNGHPKKRLPGNAHFGFRYVEGESMILMLDMKGVAAATGSACTSEALKPSHVLKALGQKDEETHGSLRLTMGRQTTKEDVDYVSNTLPEIIKELRRISPFGKEK